MAFVEYSVFGNPRLREECPLYDAYYRYFMGQQDKITQRAGGASVTDRREVCYALYSLKSTFDEQRKLPVSISGAI